MSVWSAYAAAGVVVTAVYFAISWAVLSGLARSNQLWTNPLGLATGLIFFTCAVGHLVHVEHVILGWGTERGSARASVDWHLLTADVVTAGVGLWYVSMRKALRRTVLGPSLFEDEVRARLSAQAGELAAARERFARAFADAPIGMAIVSLDGRLESVNPALCDLLDRSEDDLLGLGVDDVTHPEDLDEDVRLVASLLRGQRDHYQLEKRYLRPDGSVVHALLAVSLVAVAEDRPGYFVAQIVDLSDRRVMEQRLLTEATVDPLTGLSNRRGGLARLEALLGAQRTSGRDVLIGFVDLDRFKVVNDSLGHDVGDELLVRTSELLRSALPDGALIARLGGDEFVIALELAERPVPDAHPAAAPDLDAAVAHLSSGVVRALGSEAWVGGRLVAPNASIGITVSRASDPKPLGEALQEADIAMYAAKRRGRRTWVRYDESLGSADRARLELESALRQAVLEGALEVAYQPQIDAETSTLWGAEALVRWNRPGIGLVDAESFLAVAEDCGLIGPIGELVLADAVVNASRWHRSHGALVAHVNVAAGELTEGYAERVVALCAAHGLPHSQLRLELTERRLDALDATASTQLLELRAAGIGLALDDVGTGEASLARIMHLDLDELKVDRSFVAALHAGDGRARAVVAAVIQLGRSLGVPVVAEGAETPEQLDLLRAMGCDAIQGFGIARPGPASLIDDWIEREAADQPSPAGV